METKQNYALHTVALSALFLLGDALIDIPLPSADDKTFLCFLASVVITVILFLISYYISGLVFSLKKHLKIYKASASVVSLFILSAAAVTLARFVKFAKTVILPDVNIFALAALFLTVLLFLIFSKEKTLLKYSLLSFIIAAVIIIFFFILSLSDLTPQNIFIFNVPGLKQLFRGTYPYVLRIALPVCILPFYLRGVLEGKYKKEMLIGVSGGCGLAALVLLNSVMLFGAELAGKFDYPYSAAISTISVGYLFSRMDGFSYFLGFACALVRIGVCITTVKSLFKKS